MYQGFGVTVSAHRSLSVHARIVTGSRTIYDSTVIDCYFAGIWSNRLNLFPRKKLTLVGLWSRNMDLAGILAPTSTLEERPET